VPGHLQPADEEHVERRAERLRDLRRDGNPAARQAEHDHVLPSRVRLQPLGEQPPGLRPVPEALRRDRHAEGPRAAAGESKPYR
jgi:hypothetical protein